MRRKLLSVLTALALAAGGVVAVPAKPASAAIDWATIAAVYGYVQKAYGYWKALLGLLDCGGSSSCPGAGEPHDHQRNPGVPRNRS